jgi:predicted small lipoprotein YifL
MKRLPVLAALSLSLLTLAACGVDGPPSPPPAEEPERPASSITISGTVSAGIAGGSTRIRR